MTKEQIRLLEIDKEISVLRQEAMNLMAITILPYTIKVNLDDPVLYCAERAIREHVRRTEETPCLCCRGHCENGCRCSPVSGDKYLDD